MALSQKTYKDDELSRDFTYTQMEKIRDLINQQNQQVGKVRAVNPASFASSTGYIPAPSVGNLQAQGWTVASAVSAQPTRSKPSRVRSVSSVIRQINGLLYTIAEMKGQVNA